MQYRKLGRTDMAASVLSLGTVEFGLPYGFYHPQESPVPEKREAIRIMISAFEKGVNLLDTAPAYGNSERVVGEALKEWGSREVCVATKVPLGKGTKEIESSVQGSADRLQREIIDIVQLHNPTYEDLRNGSEWEVLKDLKQKGMVRWIGASVYGPEAAQEALNHPALDLLQVSCNLLDQRMAAEVLRRASCLGVGILVRSVLLKGVLSGRRQHLPKQLESLGEAADRAEKWGRKWGLELPAAAIRFCLGLDGVSSILLGVRTQEELRAGLNAVSGELPREAMQEAMQLDVVDSSLTDPRNWNS